MHSFSRKATPINYPVSDAEPVRTLINVRGQIRRPLFDVHFGLEFGIILSGTVRRYFPGCTRLLRPGQGWFCGMWEPHGWEVVSSPRKAIVFIIWPPLLAQLRFGEAPRLRWMAPFTMKPRDRPQVSGEARAALLERALQFERIARLGGESARLRQRLFLLDALTFFLDRADFTGAGREYPRVEHWDRLNRVLRSVFENNAFISTKQAAQECGFHRNVFSRLFAQWAGVPFSEFTLGYRLKQSADQLLAGSDPIKAIARQWGFVDASHYHKAFRKYYHCSPSRFRRKMLAD